MVAWAGVERLDKGLLDDPHTTRWVERVETREHVRTDHLCRFHARWPLDMSGALTRQEVFPDTQYKRPHKSVSYDP